MSKERIGIILDVDAEISKAKGNISSLTKLFDGVGGSKGNQLRDLLSDISAEYDKLADQSGKTMSKVGDFTKAEKSSERLNQLFRKLEKGLGDISKASGKDASKFFPSDVADKVQKASDAIKTYNTILDNSGKKKGAIGQATKEFNEQEKAVRKAAQALQDLENIKAGTSKKQVVTAGIKVDKQNELRDAKTELQNYTDELREAQQAMADLEKRKPHLWANKSWNRSQEFKDLNIELQTAQKHFDAASDKVNNLNRELKNMVVVGDLDDDIKNAKEALDNAQKAAIQLRQNLDSVTATEFTRALDEAKKKLQGLTGIDLSKIGNLDDLTSLFERFSKEGLEGVKRVASQANIEVNNLGNTNENVGTKIQNMTEDVKQQNRAMAEIDGFKNRILQFFSLDNAMQLARRGLQQTLETVKELDKAMTETAVVTDFSVGDMWDALPQYTKAANDLGTTTLGAYETMTLFYQQGLQTNEVFEIGTETMKMARIAGLEYADATNLMTAALRGFNMELNATSATKINDVYSELAAITAADTNEIATAMTKTASIANSANMEFETTAALLSQIIETTREPAETAGTALKTIIARFTEMKKATGDLVSIDGEEVSVNKVEAALRSAGVALRDVNGEFRDLDDVFLELSSKWNGLDIMTQRYVATMAAGSRQQSRFIAMMQDYDRTIELVDAAYSSSGASQKQFEKTQDSLESKINKLKNAWNEFLMGISNSKVIKAGVDALTGLLNIVNKLTGNSGIAKLAVAIGALKGGSAIFKNLFNAGKAGNGLLGMLAGFKGNKQTEASINIKPTVDESNVVGWFTQFKRNMAVLSATANGELLKVNLGFEKIGDTMVATSAQATVAGEAIEMSLSKTGIAALGASEGIEEIGEDGVTGSMKAVAAVEVLEQQYKDLERQIARVQARVAQGKMNPNVGNNYINILEGRKQNIGKDIETLKPFAKESWETQITKKFEGLTTKLKSIKPDTVAKSFKGLGKSLAGVGSAGLKAGRALIGGVGKALAAIPGWGWAAAAAIAAVAGGLYALWYNSGLQTAKRQAEADAATLEDTQAYVSGLTEKVRELDDAWDKLTTGQDALDNLTQGTIEWTQQVQALNEEVQALLEKYPELYEYLNIDKSTGQWNLDEEGYQKYQQKEQDKLTKAKNRELFEKAVSNYSNTEYEALDKAFKSDNIVNFGLTKTQTEEGYLNGLRQAFVEAYREKGQDVIGSEYSIEDILSDKTTRQYIQNMSDSKAFWNYAYNPKTALEYFNTKKQSEQQFKTESDAQIRSYLASKKYNELTQEATAQALYGTSGSLSILEDMRKNTSTGWAWGIYDVATGGAGAVMQGDEHYNTGDTVETIMKRRGYKLINADKNWYQNEITGEYVNVDVAGGGAAGGKKKKKKVNGEEVEMETWSNEYVRDLGNQDKAQQQYEMDALVLAETFRKNPDLAKVFTGDLSSNISKLKSGQTIQLSSGNIDVDEKIANFKTARENKMEELNKKYNNAFQKTKTYTSDMSILGLNEVTEFSPFSTFFEEQGIEPILEYSQATYKAAQATVEFEESVSELGSNASQSLTSTFLALQDLEDPSLNLNTVMDLSENDSNYYLKESIELLNKAGVSASGLKEYVGKIDMSSAINGARQLTQDLKAGGEEAAMAATVLGADRIGENFFSAGNQFKEMIANETWMKKTQAGLSEIYKLEGKITADNIRELAEENSDLAVVLETNSLKASGFAKMMEAVEDGTISLTDVTSDLIEIYDGLYYSADLAGEAIARLESVEIGDSDTKIGNIYSESYGAVKDLMSRGAYGDSQIDDYMHQMIGEAEWTTALANAGGDKQAALKAINSQYGLSANSGNLYGSWSKQLNNAGGSIADGAITMGTDGVLHYDLSNIESTQQLVEKIMEDTGVTKDYAETMLADMKTYSKTLGSDLDDLDKRGTLDKFLNSRITQDGVLNISKAEKATFAKSRGQTIEEFEKDLLNAKDEKGNQVIKSFEDRQYSDSGYYYSKEEEGKKTVQFTDDTAKQQLADQIQEVVSNMEGASIPLKITGADGKEELNQEYLNGLLGIDAIREIVLDPNLSEEEKLNMLKELEGAANAGTTNGVAEGLLGETSKANAANYSKYMGDEVYNEMGGALQEAINLLATYEVFIPIGFSLPVKVPTITWDGEKIVIGSTTKDLFPETSGGITIGGTTKNGQTASITSSSGGGFTPRKSNYSPAKVDIGSLGGGSTTGGTGSSYTGGNDTKNDPTKSGSGSGSKDKDDKVNYTNPTLENINEKLENLERKREKGEIDALEYEQQKKGLLGLKQGILQADLDKALANSQYKKYFGYDKETDSILLNEAEFNKLTNEKKDAVMEEYERIKGINDELNEIEDEIGEYAANANTVDAINAALEAIERKHENKDINTIEYTKERNALLSKKAIILQATLDDELKNNVESRFFYYDELLDTIMLNEEEFNQLSEERQEEVRKEYEKIKGINDELNEIEDTLKDMEFKTPEQRQQHQRGLAGEWNTQGDLDAINRKRDELGRYDELIGKLPSEMQGPLSLMTGGMGMLYEAEESQVLRRREEAYRQQLQAKEPNLQFFDDGTGTKSADQAIYYYDPASKSYQIHEDRYAMLDEDSRKAVDDELNEISGILKNLNEVEAQRSGGIFQKPFYLAEKSAKAMQKAFKNTGNTAKDVKDAFNDLEKALGLSEDALDKFEGGLVEAIEKSGLKDKEFQGLGWMNEEQQKKLNDSKLGSYMGDNTKDLIGMLFGEGSTNGMDLANTGLGALSEMFGFTGDLLSFDMMGMGLDMLNTGKGMIDQGKQMIEKIIGYITQAVQVVVDAWTNREDYLYNFLQIIEKHLRDYEKLQREANQIEKGRYASVDDIKKNWDAQWKSLQTQLEEQTERLETRQKELERSRWNPFSLISGWDPSTDTLYENRTVKFAWDLFIGFGSMAPMGLGSLFGSLNQLYEDYDKRVQNSYEDRLAAEQAILDIEDQRLELVKAGQEQMLQFEEKVMEAYVQKQQETIDELTRLNDTITEANGKLIDTLRSNLEKMRQDRENEKTEEQLGEKERRLAYLRQDTSGANKMEIKKLEEQLEDEHESYTDKLIDQKISELEEQNDKAAEQRQQQIELLQGQLDYAEKYGLYWDAIYSMLYTFDEYGNAILNPDNFDLDGNIRENSELGKMLGTFSDRIGMSVWGAIADAEDTNFLGKYYGAFIEYNGVDGNYKNAWALRNPGANDPNYAYPEQEIPDGLWGALYKLEIALKKNSIHNNPDIINRGGRIEQWFKNGLGKLFGNEEWANYEYEPTSPAHVQSTFFAGMKEDLDGIKSWFSGGTSKVSNNARNLSINSGGTQNYGDTNVNNHFNIGSVGESVSLDDLTNRMTNIFKDMFSTGNNVLRNGH